MKVARRPRLKELDWREFNEHSVRATRVEAESGCYIVSTLHRTAEMIALDERIVEMAEMMDVERGQHLRGDEPYETLVFAADARHDIVTDWQELDMARWSSEDEALDGHQAMVKKWAGRYRPLEELS